MCCLASQWWLAKMNLLIKNLNIINYLKIIYNLFQQMLVTISRRLSVLQERLAYHYRTYSGKTEHVDLIDLSCEEPVSTRSYQSINNVFFCLIYVGFCLLMVEVFDLINGVVGPLYSYKISLWQKIIIFKKEKISYRYYLW